MKRRQASQALSLALLLPLISPVAIAQVEPDSAARARPDIEFFRWQEDWSYLSDPANRTQVADDLKYIPLVPGDPKSYASFGVTLRETYEDKVAPGFGLAHATDESYLLNRVLLHFDTRFNSWARFFLQIADETAPGLATPSPADANRANVSLAFADFSGELGDGRYQIRIGRQEIAFDLQRFISVRDGANVRQAYDAIWGEYRLRQWRLTSFVSQPVQYENQAAFSNLSNHHLQYGGARGQVSDVLHSALSVTLSRYVNDASRIPAAVGHEERYAVDTRLVGHTAGFDWDIEGVLERGSVEVKQVEAWGGGAIVGYTFAELNWKPRIAIQFDAASGDRDLSSNKVQTFDPLFPNGYYINRSGYTGYSNFINLKPSVTVSPDRDVTLIAAVGNLWRQTTSDAIYAQPDIALPGTAGRGGRFTATYVQERSNWKIDRATSLAFEFDHYFIAQSLQMLGAHSSNFVGLELDWAW